MYVGLKIVTWLVDIMGLIGILGTKGRFKCKIYMEVEVSFLFSLSVGA